MTLSSSNTGMTRFTTIIGMIMTNIIKMSMKAGKGRRGTRTLIVTRPFAIGMLLSLIATTCNGHNEPRIR